MSHDGGWRCGMGPQGVDREGNARADQAVSPGDLLRAAYFGELATVIHLLRNGADIEEVDPQDGARPLFSAVMTESENVVEYLLKHRADPNAVGPKGMAPLHVACRDNSAPLVRHLLASRASPDALDGEGNTALALCVANR